MKSSARWGWVLVAFVLVSGVIAADVWGQSAKVHVHFWDSDIQMYGSSSEAVIAIGSDCIQGVDATVYVDPDSYTIKAFYRSDLKIETVGIMGGRYGAGSWTYYPPSGPEGTTVLDTAYTPDSSYEVLLRLSRVSEGGTAPDRSKVESVCGSTPQPPRVLRRQVWNP